jgi:hypothetical protein
MTNRSCLLVPLRQAKLWLASHTLLQWDVHLATRLPPPGVPMILKPLLFVVLRKPPNPRICNARYEMLTVNLVSSSYTNLEQLDDEDYLCWRTLLSTDKTMVVAAFGKITELDDSGSPTDWYNTLSIISTTTFDALPTATTRLGISTFAVAMVIPSSSAAPTPSGTSTPITNALYSLFHKPFITTIVILVSIGVAACLLFFYCCGCFRSRRKNEVRPRIPTTSQIWTNSTPSDHPPNYIDLGRIEPRTVSSPTARYLTPPAQHPAPPARHSTPPTRYSTPPARSPIPPVHDPTSAASRPVPASSADDCPHKKLTSCYVSLRPSCCSCADKRREELEREERTRTYCTACHRYWKFKSLSELPSEWGLQRAHKKQKKGEQWVEREQRERREKREQRERRVEEEKLKREKADNMKVPFYPRSNSEPEHFRSLSTTDKTHGQMQDLGPTYRAPVFHDDDRNRSARGSKGSGSQQRNTSTRDTSRADDSSAGVKINPTGSGPLDSPSAAFGGDPAAVEDEIYPKPSSSAAASSTGTARSKTSAFSAAERRRERDSRGLQRNKPRFSVNPDGTLNDG